MKNGKEMMGPTPGQGQNNDNSDEMQLYGPNSNIIDSIVSVPELNDWSKYKESERKGKYSEYLKQS